MFNDNTQKKPDSDTGKNNRLGLVSLFQFYAKISKNGNLLFFPVRESSAKEQEQLK